MAEHDDIVRRAAAVIVARTPAIRISTAEIDRLAVLLAPFFLQARKEAREGALEEAESAPVTWPSGWRDRRVEYEDGLCDGARLKVDAIRAIRSKPKEPA